MFIQQYSINKNQLALVTLRWNLFNNEKVEDTIPGSNLKTNACQTDLVIVLLSLFISSKQLLDLFHAARVINATYKKFALNI